MKRKDRNEVLFLLVILILGLAFMYLLYKTWKVFGFWNIVISGLVSFLANYTLGQMVGSRREQEGRVVYNPKEFPKLVVIAVSLLVAYYLYTIVSAEGVARQDYYYGLGYLVILSLLPLMYSLFRLFRDWNDQVILTEKVISYRNNDDRGSINLEDVEEVGKRINDELVLIIDLVKKDGSQKSIPLGNMNFNGKDTLALLQDLGRRGVKVILKGILD